MGNISRCKLEKSGYEYFFITSPNISARSTTSLPISLVFYYFVFDFDTAGSSPSSAAYDSRLLSLFALLSTSCPKNAGDDMWMMLFSSWPFIQCWIGGAVRDGNNCLFPWLTEKNEMLEVRSIPTCWVGLLLLHAQKLRPLILGSDPLFPQEPTEQLVLVFTSRLISFVGNVSLATCAY